MSGSGGRAALAIAAGVAVAAALGKVAPVAGELRATFGLSAFALGTVISLITLLTAVLAVPAASRLSGDDARRWLAGGLLLVALAGGAMALVSHPAFLIALRVGEGMGYLLVMLTGPVVLLAQVAEARRSFVLALWGACVPAGLAISAVAGGLFGVWPGWRGWFGTLAVVCLALAAAVAVFVLPAREASPRRPRLAMALRGGLLPLAAGFAAVATIGVSVLSLLPTYLRTEDHLTAGAAGALTSVVASASILGSVCAGWLLHRGIRPVTLAAAALLCPVLTAMAFLPQLGLPARTAAAAMVLFAGGVAVAAGYGALPHVAPETDRLALGNGLLIQFGSIGTLLGPPVFAAATGLRHWSVSIWLVAATSLAGVLLLHRATARPAHV